MGSAVWHIALSREFLYFTISRHFTPSKLPLLKGKLSSYRLISNFTTVSKIIQRLVLNRLRPHLLASPCFARLQSAYRCGHSTETALLHIMNSAYAAADNKEVTILVGLDIPAAFDIINHDSSM